MNNVIVLIQSIMFQREFMTCKSKYFGGKRKTIKNRSIYRFPFSKVKVTIFNSSIVHYVKNIHVIYKGFEGFIKVCARQLWEV